MDLTDIEDGPWQALLRRIEAGYRVDRDEVIALLASGESVPPAAAAWLAGVLDGTGHKFARGKKPAPALATPAGGATVRYLVRMLAARLADDADTLHDCPELRPHAQAVRAGTDSALAVAKEIVAADFGVTERQLEKTIARENERRRTIKK